MGHDYQIRNPNAPIITYACTRCGDIYWDDVIEDPITPEPTIPEPTEPGGEIMSLKGETTAGICGGLQRVLVSTVTKEHTYFYASGKLLRETITTTSGDTVATETLDFIYDSNGNPYALEYNGNTYYYITNLQGDVMYMVDASGATVATYEYDPYGKIINSYGAMAEINPLRYRGYYYDAETGFYYLQSRYYDPEICRFINADGLASTGQGFIGYNMFAYCGNNPIKYHDSEGTKKVASIYGFDIEVEEDEERQCRTITASKDVPTKFGTCRISLSLTVGFDIDVDVELFESMTIAVTKDDISIEIADEVAFSIGADGPGFFNWGLSSIEQDITDFISETFGIDKECLPAAKVFLDDEGFVGVNSTYTFEGIELSLGFSWRPSPAGIGVGAGGGSATSAFDFYMPLRNATFF